MPLPKPPGYRPRRQLRTDHRRIVFSALLCMLMAFVVLILLNRAAQVPGQLFRVYPFHGMALVVLGAGFCGAWGETMRQISLTHLGDQDEGRRHRR
jgi:hypothetical protein